jgi:dihydrofolate reductase
MRNLKLQVQMSLDGFIAGPNGEMDWMTFNWSPIKTCSICAAIFSKP